WATTSRVLKARVTKVGLAVLALTIVGTAIGTLSPLLPAGVDARLTSALPFVGAVALGIATYLTSQLLAESERQAWVKARAVAEALKSEAYKYLAGAPPYDTADAGKLLGDKAIDLQRMVQ